METTGIMCVHKGIMGVIFLVFRQGYDTKATVFY